MIISCISSVIQLKGSSFTFFSEHLDDIAGLNDVHACRAAEVREWISGSLNFCIPFEINQPSHKAGKRVLLQYPLPYKVGSWRTQATQMRNSL
ncbi:hypothetical protein BDV29DRAFT_168289 [Aspergillus leporis]|jgi:hypothetical protein|uniref:Uncharacterized protein n=1 Tax=Aspergillus leporis TaxID=41062 RepID=A0A5N5XBC2_9EURO|nr:hypothetical protein BDV29DRAFT_168289 [Aspergillus leporis]